MGARTLTAASSHRWLGAKPNDIDEPFTIGGWMRRNGGVGTGGTLVAIDTAAASARWQVTINSSLQANALASDGTTTGQSISTATLADLTWTHVGGVFASNASRTSYMDGVASTPDTTSVNVTADSLRVGARVSAGSEGVYFNGDLAHVAIWAAALSTAEMLMLAKGLSPLLIRPGALLRYFPMDDNSLDLYDVIGGYRLARNGTPSIANFKRAFTYPPTRFDRALPATFAGASTYLPRLGLLGVG